MDLRNILFYFGALGVAAFQLVRGQALASRFSEPFLRTLRSYLMAYLGYGLVFFLGMSALRQAVRDPEQLMEARQIVGWTAAPFFAGYVYLLLAWNLELIGRPLRRREKVGYWIPACALYLLTGAVEIAWRRFGEMPLFLAAARAQGLVWLAAQGIGPALLVALARRHPDPVRAALARRLGWGYLAGFLALDLFFFFGGRLVPAGWPGFRIMGGWFFLLNLPVLLYLERTLRRRPLVPEGKEGEAGTRALAESGLTEREQEIVPLVILGLTNDEIAERLFISPKTVKNNLTSIYRKTGLRNRVELSNRFRGA